MNKKFTMLVAALLAGGSFSAMAEPFTLDNTVATIEKGAQIYLVADNDGDKTTFATGDLAIGLTLSADGKTLTATTADNDGTDFDSNSAEVTNYLWTVEEAEEAGTKYYAFKNAETGKYLAFNGTALTTVAADATAAKSTIYFEYNATSGILTAKGSSNAVTVSTGSISLSSAGTAIYAYAVTTKSVSATELNSVMGGDGFSLVPAGSTTVADENNVFSQQIKAVEFAAITNSETDEQIKAGLYFVVDAPKEIKGESAKASDFLEEGKSWATATAAEKQDAIEDYIDAFNACTFIAVSPSDSYQTSTVASEGLKLITITGANLIKYEPQSNAQYATTKDQVYIGNAVFTVTEPDQYAKPGEYQLTLTSARVKESGKDSQAAATLNIGVTKIQGVNYVTTTKDPSSFKVSTSSLVKGIDLLKKEKAASVYTIKFVSGEDDEISEYGKYLASANGNQYNKDAYTLVAQGEALINTELPQYQFAITNVDVNTQKVTFSNIETGESFTTQLYATDVENQYKLVGVSNNVYVAEENAKDIENYDTKAMSAMVVELAPVEVEQYAGFFQKGIDNNEPYRLVFAKNATTNDKWYIAVNANDDSKTVLSETRSLQVVFEPVLKSDNKTIDEENISTNFVYNNGDKVYKAAADLVSYYTYKMRVVEAEDAYLNWSGSSVTIGSKAGATDVIVKYRYDGSVALIKAALGLGQTSDALSAQLNAAQTAYVYGTTYAYAVPNLNAVNLYLEAEELGVSLPAESGHFTFEAENGGFVNVSDANEGIVAIRTEAGEDLTFWVDTTDSEKIIPSFYISKAGKFMYHATDSMKNYAAVHPTKTNPYELIINGNTFAKAIFKTGELVNSDTLKTTVDNKEVIVAKKADQNKGILGNIKNFQFQIVKPSDAEDNYVIRVKDTYAYLANFNGELGFISDKDNAMRVIVEGQAAPTANEGVSATEVKVIATDGAINIKNAAGKNVVISTILGQIVANEVLTSDNATISVPAGIAIVSIDGEEAVKVSVR
jgi:hypothetical protein